MTPAEPADPLPRKESVMDRLRAMGSGRPYLRALLIGLVFGLIALLIDTWLSSGWHWGSLASCLVVVMAPVGTLWWAGRPAN